MLFLGLVGFLAVYPFLYILSMSLSSGVEANRIGFHIYPREISLASFKAVLSNPDILIGYANTIIRTVVGTALGVFMTAMLAYPLSRKELPFRKTLTLFVLFTMLFKGGVVPNYILMSNLGLLNNRLVLILPMLVFAFNVLVVKNFFQSLPESIVESARLDGAGELTILCRLVIPLSKPVLATVALWIAVMHWNQWLDALLYITEDNKQVLQVFLQRIIIENSTEMIEKGLSNVNITAYTSETIKAATVVVTILPMLFIYPFVQKFFVKGIMMGSVKE